MNTPRAERLGFAVSNASFHPESSSSFTHRKPASFSTSMPHSGIPSSETSFAIDLVDKTYFPESAVPRCFHPIILHQQHQDESSFSAQSSLSLDLNYDESSNLMPPPPPPLQCRPQAHCFDQFSSFCNPATTSQDSDEKANLFCPMRRQCSGPNGDALVFAVLEQYDPFSLSEAMYMEGVEPALTAQMAAILEAPAVSEPLNIAMDLDYASFASPSKKRARSEMDGTDDVCGPSKKKSLSYPTLDIFPTFASHSHSHSHSHASHLHPSLAPTVLELHDVPELSIPPPPPSPTFCSPTPLRRTKHQDHFLDDMSSLYSGVAEEFDDLLRNVREKMAKKEVEILVWNLASELVVDRAVGFDPVGMAISVA